MNCIVVVVVFCIYQLLPVLRAQWDDHSHVLLTLRMNEERISRVNAVVWRIFAS